MHIYIFFSFFLVQLAIPFPQQTSADQSGLAFAFAFAFACCVCTSCRAAHQPKVRGAQRQAVRMNCLAQISQVLVGLRLVLGGRHVEVQPELPKQDLLTVRPILDVVRIKN